MITKDNITSLVNEVLSGSDRFLVDVKMKPNNVIEIYIDSDTAVNIDNCVEVSRFVESKLDRDVEDFELSVMSYGLSGALKLDRQLQKYLEKDVEVKTKESGRLQGKLIAFDAEKVEIQHAPKKTSKKKQMEELSKMTFDRKTTELKPVIVF